MDEFEWFVLCELVGLYAKGFQTQAQALTAAADLAKQHGRDVIVAQRYAKAAVVAKIVFGRDVAVPE